MNILITGAASGIGNALMNECINHNHFITYLFNNILIIAHCIFFGRIFNNTNPILG